MDPMHSRSSVSAGQDAGPGEPARQAGRSSTALGLGLGVLIGPSALGVTAATIAVPTGAQALGVTTAAMAWPVTVYIAAMALASVIGGRLVRVVGRNRLLAAGAGLLVVGVLGISASDTLGMLSGSRAVLGVGAGLLAAVALGAAGESPAHLRPMVLGVLAAVMTACVGGGPLVGGLLAETSWRSAMTLPLLAVAAVPFVWRLPTQAPPASRGGFDAWGAIFLALGCGGLITALQAPATRLPNVAVLAFAAVAVVGVVTSGIRVRTTPDGFLPRAVVGRGDLVPWWIAGFGAQAGQVATLVLVPVLFAQEGDWPAPVVGVSLAVTSIAGVVSSRAAAKHAAEPKGPRLAAAQALALFLVLVTISATGAHPWVLVAAAGLAFSSFSAVQVVCMHHVCDRVPEDLIPTATGVLSLVFLVGGAAGSAITSVAGSVLGFEAASWLPALLPLAAAVAAVCARTHGRSLAQDPLQHR